MLIGKDIVAIKAEKGAEAVKVLYDRVYLEFASTDELEEFEKTSEGKPLEYEGKVWKGLRPKEDNTKANPEDLVPDALAKLKELYPEANPWSTLLKMASKGLDSTKRNNIQASQPKPMDKATAIAKLVKVLMSATKMTEAQARAVAIANIESEVNSQAA